MANIKALISYTDMVENRRIIGGEIYNTTAERADYLCNIKRYALRLDDIEQLREKQQLTEEQQPTKKATKSKTKTKGKQD